MRRNKLYSVALSLAVAFGLWLYVVNTVSQQDDRTYYNVPVVMEGESILNEDNLMITSRSTSTVSVHLSGPRGELNKITSSNSLTVKVDLSKITEPGDDIPLTYTIAYPSNVNTSSLTEESRNPQAIYVDVDYRRTKEIPVQVSWTGSRSEDYIYDTENAVLLSVHQNTFTDKKYHGAQVFYAPTEESRELAEAVQEALRAGLDPDNGRQAKPIPDSVYLLHHVTCPAVLVECGFLSNPEEEALLRSGSYQTKVAAVLAGAWLRAS